MEPYKYIQLAQRTEPNYLPVIKRLHNEKILRLLHAAIGKCTEAGEFADQIKKHIFYGKPLDEINLVEEIGDGLWYDAIACNALSVEITKIMSLNIAKLRARFPDKFTSDKAIHRDLEKERGILEGRGCAACDRGDFQLGHADWCPKATKDESDNKEIK